MPEIPVCQYCRKTVDVEEQDYVIPNKLVVDQEDWEYEHAACHDDPERPANRSAKKLRK